MRILPECYHLLATLEDRLPLRPAQLKGLAEWVTGALLVENGNETAVIAALTADRPDSERETVRKRLREFRYDGCDKAAPCHTQVEVESCFAPLLRWILSLWWGNQLALAIDVTNHRDLYHGLAISGLYRGSALPVAWQLLPGGQQEAWIPHFCRLLRLLAPAVPATMTVIILIDSGLRSPQLWRQITDLGWHPIQRVPHDTLVCPAGQDTYVSAASLVPTPDHAWVGPATVYSTRRTPATVVALWLAGYQDPQVVMTDLAPAEVDILWYSLRAWIECGFRAIKSMGLHWERSRCPIPARAARHWLVLAVTQLLLLLYGTRAEDAAALGLAADDLDAAPAQVLVHTGERIMSVLRRGLVCLRRRLLSGALWDQLWLLPEPWPKAPAHVILEYHVPT